MKHNYELKIYPSIGPAFTICLPLSATGVGDAHIHSYIESFLKEHLRFVETWELLETPKPNKPPLLKLDDYTSVMQFWAYGEYAGRPLCFVDIGRPSHEQVVRILSQFDEWYGNTDQDTELYALEYQVLARMLLNRCGLLLNPKYLDVTEPEVIAWIDDMLCEIGAPQTKDGCTAYSLARRLTQSELTALWRCCTLEELERPVAGPQFVYCGYHFQPLVQLDEDKTDFTKFMPSVKSDVGLGMSTYNWRRFPYSYENFYAAASSVGARDMDLFRCAENGKIYIPGENELFLYCGTANEEGFSCQRR